ncbi:hypothetical protein LTR47_006054 [Exophiala xenobiotica]|nr:hypothetical protein LTR41_007887 [Exophiala xenobiotica]KAK5217479.1 hypothetical protein LTR72_009596 [Exophiala xenobiotica]KAK5232827.1 hypothetical protein LTR47_006054 [Exophiala xenobiotica]KAK5255435.1 hypothetical protein LTS06_000456 [Exophiala xenobiotica]KAK5260387.1 hypothetical protein LTR40_004246 [Exophiala xenobiotica]
MLFITLLYLFASFAALGEARPSLQLFSRRSPTNDVVKLPFNKRLSQRGSVKRDGLLPVTLTNDAISYDIEVEVGTPPQTLSLQLDTGSSDLWVLTPGSCDTTTCKCPTGGCTYFDAESSTTAELLDNSEVQFNFTYGSGQVSGKYVTDNIEVGGAQLSDAIIALAVDDIQESRGILGVGLPTGESHDIPTHAGILELLVEQGFISSTSYSLYLDDYALQTGQVIFGGFDTSLYTGQLVALPIVPSSDGDSRLTVEWTGLSIYVEGSMKYSSGGSSLDAAPATLLDSGTTLAYVPNDIFQAFAEIFSLEQDPDTGVWLGLCTIQSWNVRLEFAFGMAVTISVPASQILRAWDSSGTYCQFGFQPAGDSTLYILGDAFLTSAYVYYDFNAMQIGLAQAGWTA